MIAIAVGISNIVLKRLSDMQEEHLRQLTAAYLDGLSTALQPFVIRRDVWETFDVLDRARARYAGVRAKYAIVSLPDETVSGFVRPYPLSEPWDRFLRTF